MTKRLRFEILRRDRFACRYCGAKAPETELVVDHVIPVALGGTAEPGNLVTACVPCNSGKSSTNPDDEIVDDVAADAQRWAAAMRAATQMRVEDAKRTTKTVNAVDKAWNQWTLVNGEKVPRDVDWRISVERFIRLGVTEDEIKHLIEVAMVNPVKSSETWAYFCGCCWTTLRNTQEMAAKIIEGS